MLSVEVCTLATCLRHFHLCWSFALFFRVWTCCKKLDCLGHFCALCLFASWQDRCVVRLSDFGNLITVAANALLPDRQGMFDHAALQVNWWWLLLLMMIIITNAGIIVKLSCQNAAGAVGTLQSNPVVTFCIIVAHMSLTVSHLRAFWRKTSSDPFKWWGASMMTVILVIEIDGWKLM